ncbi:MAG: hypothetical protein UU43_C0009G0003 [Candidatus Falkowbacteria bacterium GW2011_GWA2_41_14]|uniref:Uncharacterized protein n=1 Tax=Candidatus Falkowbacteria bacterium GW2011_GWA2_41_14 TaxID=1618635 RepID=A0A0G0X3R8_9BACT|nr:MAG: hypothetical protein UU43_C0009G0003 [Candidatus Falkowbacteria bacterium GW2011_GWA2_41_14]
MTKKTTIVIRVFLWLILAVALGWFAYFKIVPSGKISYVYNFSKPSFFIGKLSPAERVEISPTGAKIKGDPVYFSLRPPRRFERASVTIKFKNTTNFPVMEMGLLNDKIAWGYDLQPLENKIIDQLSLVWPVVYGQKRERLIEREKKYETVEEFLSNLPTSGEIALYDYSLKNNFLLDKYEPGGEKQQIDYSWRGSYQFYTYIKNEDLDYVFNFTDLNINQDNDPVDIKVYSSDGLIRTEHIADDLAASPERQARLKIAGLKEGVYRLSFIANDDIITKNIASAQSQFALINKIWLYDNNKTPLVLYTNSHLINAQTVNPASKGKIKVGESTLDLKETYRQISLKIISQPAKIELAKDDIIISGDGVFSLNEAGFLDPRFKRVDKNLDINQKKINYILTNYQAPLESGEWRIATADFDLTKAYQENGKYQFLISVPGLKAEESVNGALIIKEIKIDLSGASLRQKFNKFFK